MTDSTVRQVNARTLKNMLHDGGEIAVLDAREEGVFSERHLLLVSVLPLSHVETRIATLVPRRTTRIVVCDAGEGQAVRAAERLIELGYSDVAVLSGGVEAWGKAGFELYSGVNVPSKAFGEFVEHEENTPRMSAKEIQALRDKGEDLIILDSRPFGEFHRMSIPGGIDCPGAELAFRAPGLVPSPETLVVVNCAGRTRSIIGAQSLINAGLPNKVVALKDGTMGWHLAGLELEHGQDKCAPAPEGEALERAKQGAEGVAKRFGVKTISQDELKQFRTESDTRNLFLLDVRDPEEFVAGHLPGSRSAPGGQLVQATDTYIGVRGARVVLLDDHGVRARMTASWLVQMGWDDVYVLDDAFAGHPLEKGHDVPPILGLAAAHAPSIAAENLAPQLLDRTAVVVDLASSLMFRDAHVPGAWFAVRANMPGNLRKLPAKGRLVFTSPDGILARFTAAEMAGTLGREVCYLEGGTAAWIQAGMPLEKGDDRLADDTNDVSYKAYDHKSNVEDRMQAYLDWEVALVEQIGRDDDAQFRAYPRA